MRTDGEPADFFHHLDDPAFLAERARLRSRLERVPENAVGRPRLERLYEAMTEEFCRRARLAWTRGRLTSEDDANRSQGSSPSLSAATSQAASPASPPWDGN